MRAEFKKPSARINIMAKKLDAKNVTRLIELVGGGLILGFRNMIGDVENGL
ncbi:hypothetical protein SAMN05660772_00053 [Pasteurella testudinis DSM 23072]|uniref:Uncharacterized protein n=1 Tax=Pasteurella testudinis DSM 23072 TaxID=1122938 RepID=A0A1W1UAR7_9PAST|nr:hypothetical protein SAMN05660772_00053 [Pasteurella testudinis DSM 23072]SUB52664.1 Uncharacterised protein [Pasteurella testudinis]